jgi:hypothetical protein
MKPAKHLTHIEPLEARIAPALIINPYTVTFQNGNGATAVVKISKPLFTSPTAAGNILQFVNNSGTSITESFTGNATAENLNNINLLGRTDASGMNISVTVLPQVGVGKLEVDVGGISAANFSVPDQVSQNIDLGAIYIQGNLGFITAGASNNYFNASVGSLNVQSMTTGETSEVLGPIGSLTVQNNFSATLFVIGYQFGNIGTLTIGGKLTGDAAGDAQTGYISFTGRLGSATIGNIVGGAASYTGDLVGTTANPSSIGTLTINGTTGIQGGAGTQSGFVYAQSGIGSVNITVGGIQGGAGQQSGEIAGPLGNVHITGNVIGGSGLQSGAIFSEYQSATSSSAVPLGIGNVFIGGNLQGGNAGSTGTAGLSGVIDASSATSIIIQGSLIGGTFSNSSQDADTSGAILVNTVPNLEIVGSIMGGSGANSGLITSPGGLGSHYGNIYVSGNITGGSGALSGAIDIGSATGLYIGGNVAGGTGTQSGYISTGLNLGTLSLAGSVIGGQANNSGEITVGGTLGSALIKGNLTGGNVSSLPAVYESGYLQANTFTSLHINGNVTAGSNSGPGGIADSGAIAATENIVSLTIGGTVTGTQSDPVIISALYGPATTTKTDVAIASATFQKSVNYLDLLAGYAPPTVSSGASSVSNPRGTPSDTTAQIGTVTVLGNLSASNIVAGAVGVNQTGYPPDGEFGTSGDTAIPAAVISGLHSSIAKIVIGGTATGDSTTGDSYGFVAQDVMAVEVGGTYIVLTPGVNMNHGIPVGGNLVVNEVAPAV